MRCLLKTLSLFIFLTMHADSFAQKHTYKHEFKELKKKKPYNVLFKKDGNQILQQMQADIENCSQLTGLEQLARFAFLPIGVVVNSQTMPKLYTYVDKMCQRYSIKTPVIFISRKKEFLNTSAQKLFFSSGSIIIGQNILDRSDEEVEAIVAHEIGHIYHNHSNKKIVVWLACLLAGKLFLDVVTNRGLPLKMLSTIAASPVAYKVCKGKKYEREADAFAFDYGKAEGIEKFLQWFEQRELEEEQDFITVKQSLQEHKLSLVEYYVVRGFHKLGRHISWLYSRTPFSAHYSNKERIEMARAYIKAKENKKTEINEQKTERICNEEL